MYDTPDKVADTYETLQRYNFTKNEIILFPKILSLSPPVIETRYKLLIECGFKKVTTAQIACFLRIMSSNLELLKSHYIPVDLDIMKHLLKFIDLDLTNDISSVREPTTLLEARKIILSIYLTKKLNFDNDNFEKYWQKHCMIKYRCLHDICQMINVLKNDYKFDNDKILKNR